MTFLIDGKIDAIAVKSYTKAITAELAKESKATLAVRLALEIVYKTIQQELDDILAGKDNETKALQQRNEKLMDEALETWESRSSDWIFGLTQKIRQKNRRMGKTKLSDSQKRQVVREYEAAVVTRGMIKGLARKFDVSEDTISREVNRKID